MAKTKRYACITGGTSGIGEGITAAFLEQGYNVLAIGYTKEHADELQQKYGSDALITLNGDLCTPEMQQKLAQTIEKQWGQLDVLVNSAGRIHLSEKGGGIHEPLDIWQKTLDINLLSVHGTIQALYPLLQKGKKPSIINISSVCSLHSFSSCSSTAYSVSKIGVDLLTKRLAQQLAPEGIRVNAINPGVVESNIMNSAGVSPQQQQDFKDRILKTRHPIGRIGEPEDIARAALYFADPANDWTTGAILSVDGGYSTT